MQQITIRKATQADAAEISQLIVENAKLLLADEFEGEGLDFFLNAASTLSIKEYMGQGFNYLVAICCHKIVGVIAMKDHRHMFHLFVDKDHHKQGIAKQLWDDICRYSIEKGHTKTFILNSTTYALPIYRRWGFEATDAMQLRHGISYTPMSLTIEDNA